MTPAQEWEAWRKKREAGQVTRRQWLEWAEAYLRRLDGGPWRSHVETHIRFIKRQEES